MDASLNERRIKTILTYIAAITLNFVQKTKKSLLKHNKEHRIDSRNVACKFVKRFSYSFSRCGGKHVLNCHPRCRPHLQVSAKLHPPAFSFVGTSLSVCRKVLVFLLLIFPTAFYCHKLPRIICAMHRLEVAARKSLGPSKRKRPASKSASAPDDNHRKINTERLSSSTYTKLHIVI